MSALMIIFFLTILLKYMKLNILRNPALDTYCCLREMRIFCAVSALKTSFGTERSQGALTIKLPVFVKYAMKRYTFSTGKGGF